MTVTAVRILLGDRGARAVSIREGSARVGGNSPFGFAPACGPRGLRQATLPLSTPCNNFAGRMRPALGAPSDDRRERCRTGRHLRFRALPGKMPCDLADECRTSAPPSTLHGLRWASGGRSRRPWAAAMRLMGNRLVGLV